MLPKARKWGPYFTEFGPKETRNDKCFIGFIRNVYSVGGIMISETIQFRILLGHATKCLDVFVPAVMCVNNLRNVYLYLYILRAPWIIMTSTYDNVKRLFMKENIWILTWFYFYLWGQNMWLHILQFFHTQISSSWKHSFMQDYDTFTTHS